MTRKIQNLLSAGAGAIGLVTAVGVKTFLRPCVHADGSAAPCAGAGQLILVLGILLALAGAGMALARGRRCFWRTSPPGTSTTGTRSGCWRCCGIPHGPGRPCCW